MGAVDERFGQVELAALVKVSRESGESPVQNALALPLLEAVMARLIRRVATRQVCPWRTGAQDPQDPVEHVPRIPPRSPSACRRPLPLWLGDTAPNRLPLLVGEIHRRRYKHLLRPMEIGSSKMEQSRSLTRRPVVGCALASPSPWDRGPRTRRRLPPGKPRDRLRRTTGYHNSGCPPCRPGNRRRKRSRPGKWCGKARSGKRSGTCCPGRTCTRRSRTLRRTAHSTRRT